ncbi:MAG TPA: hypothetical protein VMU61_01825 [Candidatus Aquilonibacter sp.]|nr:hypothetical protein [Candidatus Aquilonibacter sp.]
MILGLSKYAYTLIHVVISLIGIGSGLVVLWGMIRNKALNGITFIFLTSTLLTSLTGFGFPNDHLTPGLKVGIISVVLLALAIPARYVFHLGGVWRRTYVITAGMALYLNVFVLIVQLFEKSATLRVLAPTQKEPPFVITQLAVLLAFVVLTIFAAKNYRSEPARTLSRAA